MLNLRVGFRWLLITLGLLSLGIAVLAGVNPKVRQGLVIVRSKATGSLPDISWVDLFRMFRSGKRFNLPGLASTQNPYASIANPYSSLSDAAAGRETFLYHCAVCHGANGEGGHGGPRLLQRRMAHGTSYWAIFRTISLGVPGTGMPANNLPWVEKWQLVTYVRSLVAGTASATDVPSIPEDRVPSIDYAAILNAAQNSNAWLTYSGSYDGHRFSRAKQITSSNVSGLRLLWGRQYNTSEATIETSPLVVGDYMFITLPPSRVEALDAKTGALIWAYERELPGPISLCCGVHNRGLAVLGNTLFFGALDAHLVALDIHTGRPLWDVEMADYKGGYSITSAPLVLKNLVITGIAGGEFGIRGFIDARDAVTGKEVWRFNTIPEPEQPGADTWAADSAKTGGVPTWLTGSFDPSSNLIYWPTGNPGPDYDGSVRSGDNLYSNSVVALDAEHGTLRWHFQFLPHDVYDWDSTQILLLLDGSVAGKRQRLLAQANRDGFFYLLDAQTGAFLFAKPFARVTWAKGINQDGRPELNPEAQPTERGTPIYPGGGGATNWESPSYSPMTGLLYVPIVDWGAIFTFTHTGYRRGELFAGGAAQALAESTSESAVRALNPMTGEVQWEFRSPATSFGGLLSTEGGLIFGGQDENFFALDAKTGRELWHVGTGGRVTAAPITFVLHGKQVVTVAAGHDLLTFGL